MSDEVPSADRSWPDWGILCEVVWQASALNRRSMHAAVSGRGCPGGRGPYGADRATGSPRVECANAGCLDFYHDLLLACHQRLEGACQAGWREPDDLRRYAFVVATRTIVDLKRRHRVRLGFPARPGRQDGPARRVVTALCHQRPSEAEWLTALFRMVREYAHTLDRTLADWPVDRWAREKTAYDGITRESTQLNRREIRADIAEVLTTAAGVLGPDWVVASILAPLRRGARAASIDDAPPPAVVVDLTEMVLCRSLRTSYLAARSAGVSATEAYRTAAGAVARIDDPPVTPEVRSLLRELDVELLGSL